MRFVLRWLLRIFVGLVKFTFNVSCAIAPAFLVFLVLTSPTIQMNRGVPLIRDTELPAVHEIIPHTRWGNMRPCNEFWNEQEEFEKALQCVNTKVWPKTPLKGTDFLPLVPPRCFVVSAESPDVFSTSDGSFNFIPLKDILGVSAILGVYQPETRTVYIVENIDGPNIYRHELQHLFLHMHDPKTEGGGHDQSIWSLCEPPYYTPSAKAKILGKLRDRKIKTI